MDIQVVAVNPIDMKPMGFARRMLFQGKLRAKVVRERWRKAMWGRKIVVVRVEGIETRVSQGEYNRTVTRPRIAHLARELRRDARQGAGLPWLEDSAL
jgi:hypothetical protein